MHYKEKQPGIELTASKKKNGTLGLEDKSTEVRDLLDSMERDPLLRHELLVYFYKHKNKHRAGRWKKLTIKKSARCSHQTKCALPPHFPKGPSIGQNRFQKIISGIFFNYYKPLKTTKR
jgi:hypothetical protein